MFQPHDLDQLGPRELLFPTEKSGKMDSFLSVLINTHSSGYAAETTPDNSLVTDVCNDNDNS